MSKTGEFGCPRCDARWNGTSTAHCAACHETFTRVTVFDRHRTGTHSRAGRHCLAPVAVGLVDAGRAYQCWCTPGEDDWEFGDG